MQKLNAKLTPFRVAGDGNDALFGGSGADLLIAGAGDDDIDGDAVLFVREANRFKAANDSYYQPFFERSAA